MSNPFSANQINSQTIPPLRSFFVLLVLFPPTHIISYKSWYIFSAVVNPFLRCWKNQDDYDDHDQYDHIHNITKPSFVKKAQKRRLNDYPADFVWFDMYASSVVMNVKSEENICQEEWRE